VRKRCASRLRASSTPILLGRRYPWLADDEKDELTEGNRREALRYSAIEQPTKDGVRVRGDYDRAKKRVLGPVLVIAERTASGLVHAGRA
jgi:hypothetical protein